MLAALRAGWVVFALGLAAAVTTTLVSDVNAAEHDQYWHAVREARELDARLNEEVAKSRLGIVTHYDGLVRTNDELARVGAILARIPAFIDQDSARRLDELLAAYHAVLDEKLALIERFKSELAILRNSLRAFPHNADRFLAQSEAKESEAEELGPGAEAGPGGGPLSVHDAVLSLEHDVMLLAINPSEAALQRARCSLAPFDPVTEVASGCHATTVAPVAPERENALDLVVSHGRMIMERHAVTERLLNDVMTLPVSSHAMAIGDAYSAAHMNALETAQTRRLITLALAAGLFLLSAVYIIVRMQASASALRETTGQLEVALGALARERDREKELADLKSRFVSMTSHEFRSPLSVILSSSELLEAYGERWTPDKRATHLERVRNAAKDMSRMLDGVLLIGRAEAGMLELNTQPVELSDLCGSIVDEVRSSVGAGRHLEVIDESPDERVWLDEKLVRHVLTNLLTNAFKYSPNDTPVRLEMRGDQDRVEIVVSDDGIGIPEEDQAALFDAFYRCSNATGIPGNGLGLAVVKKSLDVHGGSIAVDSVIGEGTRFTVRIPCGSEANT